MKVGLINPPRSPHNAILEHASEAARPFIHRKLVGPPLGLLTVAAAVAPRHALTLLELKGELDLDPGAPPPDELVRAWVAREQPRVVGVTAITSEARGALAALAAVKAVDPRALTVVGGLHASLCPLDFEQPWVDVVVPGHGAQAFRAVVEAFERGRAPGEVPGIWARSGERLRFTGPAAREPEPAGRDFLPLDRRLLERWRSTYLVRPQDGPITYLFTSLGCPGRCTFCSIWPQHEGRYLQRSVDSVLAELRELQDYPVVRFADASSLVDPAFLEALFERLAAEGLQKLFVMDMRVDSAVENPRLIERLARGGLRVVICGFESFRDAELQAYGKAARSAQIAEAIRIFHENGIMLRGNYVVPPDYGPEDFAALADWAASHRVAYAGYTVLTPMPGTPLHAAERDRIVDHDLERYNFFNCVLPTRLELPEFYRRVADLWLIKQGRDVI
ncbi:MAG TPA: radical SAM protein [Myxococcota bacterium]|nr:radical SAM protein [Myxococcota bacterium]HRY92040.1 radical SAM protein [Myxococcota bacterium]HSA23202.1 radical SAM protein [Myxococcota bacterium]